MISQRLKQWPPKKIRTISERILLKESGDIQRFTLRYIENFIQQLPNYYRKKNIQYPDPQDILRFLSSFKPSAEKIVKPNFRSNLHYALFDYFEDNGLDEEKDEIYLTPFEYQAGYLRRRKYTTKIICRILFRITHSGDKILDFFEYYH